MGLGVDVYFSAAATMPGCEQDATAATLVLNILQRVHNVGNAAQAE